MTSLLDQILRQSQQYAEEYLRDLGRLVAIDSGTFDKAGVDRAGALLRDLLAELGCQIQIHRQTDFGDHFTATLTGRGSRRLMLLGHFDTVYPAGTASRRPFAIRDSRAYGPGSMDMKGGMMLGIYAMRVLRAVDSLDFAEITFVANSDEEVGSLTSRPVIQAEAARMDAVFVLEPSRALGGVLATRKGVGMYRMEVQGRASHAGGAPREGRSANLELAHKIIALHELNDFDTGTTVSANVIGGGSRRNVIPDSAFADIDLRVPTRAEGERADAAIQAIAARCWVPDTTTSLTGGLNRPPMEKVPGTAPLLALARMILDTLGVPFQELTSGGGSDGNFTAALGVPTLEALGPLGQNAHTADEYIEVGSIPQRMALLAALLAQVPPRGA